ncbi:shikimate kinase [Jannaschia aquimarina]|uniref:Shikimate kinase n=1 Tax=Jannaschia aquimarina TaxID=935700 RepID=A0A0D1EJF8_9RHOB|nr:shikimate kinase [Jannaschia aquimarina]KIT15935.1 Shikimate kinase 1 [Jannaschia aquimarina]SNS98183.1 shikimate kinase [Jannaschia aquimarina]
MGRHMPGEGRPIVLVGMMGSGKTAVGTALAERLDVPFRDTDEAIVAASRMSIAEIFERDGEAFFRAREREILNRLLDAGPGVVSTGGGIFLDQRNRDAIAARGVSVWLRASADLLWSRVKHRTTRPLLMTSDPRGTLERLLAERTPHYANAQVIVDAHASYSISDMVDHVIEALLQISPETSA